MQKRLILGLIVCSLSAILIAQTGTTPGTTRSLKSAPSTQVQQQGPLATQTPGGLQPIRQCADPAAKLTVTKSLAGTTGTVTLSGQVCNVGAGNYTATVSMDGFYMVYTWHPPKSAAQEGDVKLFGHTPLGNTLAPNQCRPVLQTYQIPNVIRWGEPPLTAPLQQGQRAAVKQFVLKIEKQNPPAQGFTKQENCRIDNDGAEVTIPYIEKTT